MVNSIFLGEVGLTSTSANHLANLAKESYMEKEAKLNDISFIDKEVSLLNGDSKPVSFGWKSLDSLKEDLKVISELKGFIAWLREAIKAKEALIKESKTLSMDYFNLSYPEIPHRGKELTVEDLGLTYPEAPEKPKEITLEDLGLSYPEEPIYTVDDVTPAITEDDFISSWSIKKRSTYLRLEAEAATLGIIHPNGSFSKARKNLIKILSKPISTEGSGRDMVVYTSNSSIEPSEVESYFMELQQKFRSTQAELNSLKFEIESAVKADEIRYATDKAKATETYNLQLAEYNKSKFELDQKLREANQTAREAYRSARKDYDREVDEINQKLHDANKAAEELYQNSKESYETQRAIIDRQLAEARLKEEKYRSSLKIIIPDCFKDIKKQLEEL